MADKPEQIAPLKSLKELPALLEQLMGDMRRERFRHTLESMKAASEAAGDKFTVEDVNWAIGQFNKSESWGVGYPPTPPLG